MPTKNKNKKQPNLQSRIVKLVFEDGPRPQNGMTKILGIPYQSLNTEILELVRIGVLQKGELGILSLIEDVDLSQFGVDVPKSDKNQQDAKTDSEDDPNQSWRDGDFTHQEKFVRLLKSVGVKQEISETICAIYFNGNVNSIYWLHKVLLDISRGFVTEDQAKMIMPSWAYYWGMHYDFDKFFGD